MKALANFRCQPIATCFIPPPLPPSPPPPPIVQAWKVAKKMDSTVRIKATAVLEASIPDLGLQLKVPKQVVIRYSLFVVRSFVRS